MNMYHRPLKHVLYIKRRYTRTSDGKASSDAVAAVVRKPH